MAVPEAVAVDADVVEGPKLALVSDGESTLIFENEEAWEAHGWRLASDLKASQDRKCWEIGDWIVAAERDLDGDDKSKKATRYTRACDVTGLRYGTLRNYACTARAFPDVTARRYKLAFAHYRVVAGRKDPDVWLAKAEKCEWSEKTLRLKINESNGKRESKPRPVRVVLSIEPDVYDRVVKKVGGNDEEGVTKNAKEWIIGLIREAMS